MANNMTEGFLPIREGSIYWKGNAAAVGDGHSRPTLLLIHAGVADHTMWDRQVDFFNRRGWNCLRFDQFGYGSSHPNEEYLYSQPRDPFDPIEYIERLRQTVLGPDADVIVIGLSQGSKLSLTYTLTHPEHIIGLVLCSGGPEGFEWDNDPAEDRLFEKVASLIEIGDVQGAAQMQVRIWGDGPLQEPGRLADVAEDVEARMLQWNEDISARECSKRGGDALEMVEPDPLPIARLHRIEIPTALCWGTFDSTLIQASMRYVAGKLDQAVSQEFETAHMINLEKPDEFNEFIDGWLEAHFE